jgi:hypothetical protein
MHVVVSSCCIHIYGSKEYAHHKNTEDRENVLYIQSLPSPVL